MLKVEVMLQKLRMVLFLLLVVWGVAAGGSEMITSLMVERPTAGELTLLAD